LPDLSRANAGSLSGVELQSHLIAQSDRTPMIFVTACPEENTRARALKAGAIGLLTKPFNEERLIEYIHAALSGWSNLNRQALDSSLDHMSCIATLK
jgi:FixJ family two-component response regulator